MEKERRGTHSLTGTFLFQYVAHFLITLTCVSHSSTSSRLWKNLLRTNLKKIKSGDPSSVVVLQEAQ